MNDIKGIIIVYTSADDLVNYWITAPVPLESEWIPRERVPGDL